MFLFSVLFALSMEYQGFLTSRIKQRSRQGGSPATRIPASIAGTARIITGAALIIVAVFAGFARGQLVDVPADGLRVAVALLLDATVVRTVILPSTLTLLDFRNWSCPAGSTGCPASGRRPLPSAAAYAHRPAGRVGCRAVSSFPR